MDKPKHQILFCASFRAQGTPQGICHKKESLSLIPNIESELADCGMTDVTISATGCLNLCKKRSCACRLPRRGLTRPLPLRLNYYSISIHKAETRQG
jgi:predicted metal-binding protein